eukprot:767403-Hanusia_phi.AAC.3
MAATLTDRVCPAAARRKTLEKKSVVAAALAAVLLVVLCLQLSGSQGSQRRELGAAGAAGGSAIDISALPSADEQRALTQLHAHSAPVKKAGYDSLLSNGPFVPPRSKMLEKLSRKSMLGSTIGIDGSVHLLRSAKEILEDRLHPSRKEGSASTRRGGRAYASKETVEVATGGEEEAEEGLREQKRRLAAKLKKLEEAAGANEFYGIKMLNH